MTRMTTTARRLSAVAGKRKWLVLTVAFVCAAAGTVWGGDVFKNLSNGGFDDPRAESARVENIVQSEFPGYGSDLIFLYSSAYSTTNRQVTIDDPDFENKLRTQLTLLKTWPEVKSLVSIFDTRNTLLLSADRTAVVVPVKLKRPGNLEDFAKLAPFMRESGLTVQIGGDTALAAELTHRAEQDLLRAELFSMPILLVLLVLIFRNFRAALSPLVVGSLAIIGALAITRFLCLFTEVSVFAVNLVTVLGLGMAIDYSLFMVKRFREEIEHGSTVPDALEQTISHAGRTVFFSSLLVSAALSSLLVFPQALLRSIGIGGILAVLVAGLVSLTVLPALLAIAGPKILPWRKRWAKESAGIAAATADSRFWRSLAKAVTTRPLLFLLLCVGILAVFAWPVGRLSLGGIDERSLPANSEIRSLTQKLLLDFPSLSSSRLVVLYRTPAGDSNRASADINTLATDIQPTDTQPIDKLVNDIRELPTVKSVRVSGRGEHTTLIEVLFEGASDGREGRDLTTRIRSLARQRAPADITETASPGSGAVLVGGRAAQVTDRLQSLSERLPLMGLIAVASTFLFLYLATRSVVVPIKAIVMNLVSIGASFGILVWAFQDGNLSALLSFTATGDIEAGNLVLMLVVVFGLSTDYELFLLARVREAWDSGGDNTAAIRAGMEQSGGIISGAALLLVVVVSGLLLADAYPIKMLGFGMVAAIIVDATLVRSLLVPATLALLGKSNWWPSNHRDSKSPRGKVD